MNSVGIIAEYNPFHNGHLYQIKKIKEQYPNSIIIAIVSSSFTQRGNISVLDKWQKTEIALDNNIDLVIELPFVYATQSSDIFAKGAVELLNYLKVDTIVFGTEREALKELELLTDIQTNNKNYHIKVKEYLKQGLNYPSAASKALSDLTNIKVDTPNDLLALSYLKQIKQNNYKITCKNIKRTIDYHTTDTKNNITSASNIRRLFEQNQKIDNLIPYNMLKLTKVDINTYFQILKYKIIEDYNNLQKYQTVDEGIEGRIKKNIFTSNTYEELIQNVKTKRYTYNKISRMFLHILTSFTKEEAKNIKIDYIRVLGFSNKGKEYLHKIKKEITLPIITGYKKDISKVLDIELRVSQIYSLITSKDIIKEEYRKKPIIK